MSRNCYTYLVGWSKLNKFYYGVRYARNCNPSDLWKSYFTSSRFVKELRINYGEPDVIEIRKEFGDDAKSAKNWEDKVLIRLNVLKSDKWLNRTRNNSFDGISASWNEGLTKETNESLKTMSNKMKKIRKEQVWSIKGIPKTREHNKLNAWSQIKKHNPNIEFNSYDEYCIYCQYKFNLGIGAYTIAVELGVTGNSIKTALKYINGNNQQNQSWTKIKKRYPDFRFESYEIFCRYCAESLKSGEKVYKISKTLGLSECTINRAIKFYSSD